MNPICMGLLLGVRILRVRAGSIALASTLAVRIELIASLGALRVRIVFALLDVGRLGTRVECAGGAVVLVGALRIRVEFVAGFRALRIGVELVAGLGALAIGIELLVGLCVGQASGGCHDSNRCHEGETFVRHLKLLSYGSFGLITWCSLILNVSRYRHHNGAVTRCRGTPSPSRKLWQAHAKVNAQEVPIFLAICAKSALPLKPHSALLALSGLSAELPPAPPRQSAPSSAPPPTAPNANLSGGQSTR